MCSVVFAWLLSSSSSWPKSVKARSKKPIQSSNIKFSVCVTHSVESLGENRIRKVDAPRPVSKKQGSAGILLSLSFQSLSTQPLSAIRNMIVHVFGGSGVCPPLPPASATKRGRHSKSSDGCKARTEKQVPTISPVCSATPHASSYITFQP